MYKVGHIFGISVFDFLQPVIEKAYLLTFDAGIDEKWRGASQKMSTQRFLVLLNTFLQYVVFLCQLILQFVLSVAGS